MYEDKTVFVWDSGLYPYVAEKLGESFGRTLYYCDVREPFPTSAKGLIGVGLKNVERVYEAWAYLDEVDLWVFPDIHLADEQEQLRSLGKAVWGSGHTDQLELDRWGMHIRQKSMGLSTPHAKLLEGMDELRLHLAEHEDKYIKTSFYRGDFETFHHERFELSEPWLDELAHRLGPRQKYIKFIVEDPVHGVEVGYDGYHVGGVFGPLASFGYEVKDSGFVGQFREFSLLPKPILQVTEAFSPLLKGVSAYVSNEERVTPDGESFLIDPCMRCASPPTEALLEAIDNWDEVLYEGARGNLVEWKPNCKYFAQIVLKSEWVTQDWLPVHYPASAAKYVKLKNKVVIDGINYVATQGYPHFGSAIGLGNSLEEAIKQCKKNAEAVECLEKDYNKDVFDQALDQIEEGNKNGVDW